MGPVDRPPWPQLAASSTPWPLAPGASLVPAPRPLARRPSLAPTLRSLPGPWPLAPGPSLAGTVALEALDVVTGLYPVP